MQIRQLTPADLSLLRQIDRSEHQHIHFSVTSDELISRPLAFDVPGWDPVGNGPHSVGGMIDFAQPIVARGAELVGAFFAEELAGLVVVEAVFEPGLAWLALLHVDRSFRRLGVASALWRTAEDRARAVGARRMYVSATPSDSAVGFYLSRGCRLADRSEVNDDLHDLEPDDIHLICDLEHRRADGASPVRS